MDSIFDNLDALAVNCIKQESRSSVASIILSVAVGTVYCFLTPLSHISTITIRLLVALSSKIACLTFWVRKIGTKS